MYELDSVVKTIKTADRNTMLSDMKKSMQQVVNELKLTADDTKGLVVDKEIKRM